MADSQPPSGAGQLGDIPHLRLPQPEVLFSRRAERFAALAPGHTLSEYLDLLACIAAAQLAASATAPARHAPARHAPRAVPAGEAGAEEELLRPLDAAARPRSSAWRDALRVILSELSTVEMPAEGRAAVEQLSAAAPDHLEALADRVLSNAVGGADLAAGPLVAAALQVHFTDLAARLAPGGVSRANECCPVCGSLPVTGIVLGDDRVRYLVCSLCGTQWHRTRLQCAACGEAKNLGYYALEGAPAAHVSAARAVKAEACPTCKAYTKLFYVEQDPRLEPFADDVATLALDLLMAENGWARYGVNLFLIPAPESRSA